jgi:uncharacterized membrane protein YedE/YeeE
MIANLRAFHAGIIFAIGLGIAGMTRPENVIGFLDVTDWQPALMFVMVGAITVYATFYWLLLPRIAKPTHGDKFQIPTSTVIDSKLILGAIIFGAGWGIGGYCPGPALASLATLSTEALTVVASMLIGMKTYVMFSKK